MAEKTQKRVERAQRRQDPDGGSPPAANPETVERGKKVSEKLDALAQEIDELLAQEAERRGHGTGEAASIAAADEIVNTYVQFGGE
ncbi:ubiquitin-like protein Pup [Candidatus Parcubacteria bacterium]|nr:ubiquitin-like protein Pup [Candidatus Parcubacteria bacterium]